MADCPTDNSPRISLRQLFVVMTVFTVYFAMLGWAIQVSEIRSALSVIVPGCVFVSLLLGTPLLYRWRLQARRRQSLNHVFGVLHPTPRLTEMHVWLGAAVACVLAIVVLRGPAATLPVLLYAVPLIAIGCFWEWLKDRRAIVTDRGVLIHETLVPWPKVVVTRDNPRGVATLSAAGNRHAIGRQFAVPEELLDTVKRLHAGASAMAAVTVQEPRPATPL